MNPGYNARRELHMSTVIISNMATMLKCGSYATSDSDGLFSSTVCGICMQSFRTHKLLSQCIPNHSLPVHRLYSNLNIIALYPPRSKVKIFIVYDLMTLAQCQSKIIRMMLVPSSITPSLQQQQQYAGAAGGGVGMGAAGWGTSAGSAGMADTGMAGTGMDAGMVGTGMDAGMGSGVGAAGAWQWQTGGQFGGQSGAELNGQAGGQFSGQMGAQAGSAVDQGISVTLLEELLRQAAGQTGHIVDSNISPALIEEILRQLRIAAENNRKAAEASGGATGTSGGTTWHWSHSGMPFSVGLCIKYSYQSQTPQSMA